jgi:hypothetical protein
MSHGLHLGGVSYSVEVPDGFEVMPSEAQYEPFRAATIRSSEVAVIPVTVRIDRGQPERPTPAQILFDTNQSWFVQKDGADLVFILRGPNNADEPLWSARLSHDRRRVRLCCDDQFWMDGSAPALHDPFVYPLDQLVTMMVLAHHRGGAILHAAGVTRKGRAIACIGVSGAGKSTLSNLLGESFTRLSDDRVIIRASDTRPILFGTPWAGEAGIACSESAPLAALVFLHKADTTEIRPIERDAALRQLLPTLSVPWFEERAAGNVLKVGEYVLELVQAYDLHFRPDRGVEEVLAGLI